MQIFVEMGTKVDYQVLKMVPWVNSMMTDSEKIDYFK